MAKVDLSRRDLLSTGDVPWQLGEAAAPPTSMDVSDPSTFFTANGARTAVTDPRPTPSTMPSYDCNDDVAAVATYVRNSWGNAVPKVTADQIKTLRWDLKATAH